MKIKRARRVRIAGTEGTSGGRDAMSGQDRANPLAELLSYSMMLRYSFDMGDAVFAELDRLRLAA